MGDPLSRSKAKVIIGIVTLVLLVGLGAMLLIGLVQGDEVDREENPVIGSLAGPLSRAG